MPIYEIQGPDGKVYEVESASTPTDEQLAAAFGEQSATPTEQPSFADQFGRAMLDKASAAPIIGPSVDFARILAGDQSAAGYAENRGKDAFQLALTAGTGAVGKWGLGKLSGATEVAKDAARGIPVLGNVVKGVEKRAASNALIKGIESDPALQAQFEHHVARGMSPQRAAEVVAKEFPRVFKSSGPGGSAGLRAVVDHAKRRAAAAASPQEAEKAIETALKSLPKGMADDAKALIRSEASGVAEVAPKSAPGLPVKDSAQMRRLYADIESGKVTSQVKALKESGKDAHKIARQIQNDYGGPNRITLMEANNLVDQILRMVE